MRQKSGYVGEKCFTNTFFYEFQESDITLDDIAALMQLGLLQSNSLCPEDVKNTLMFDKVLNAAQAAKIIARKIKPEQMKLLEAAVNSASDGKPTTCYGVLTKSQKPFFGYNA